MNKKPDFDTFIVKTSMILSDKERAFREAEWRFMADLSESNKNLYEAASVDYALYLGNKNAFKKIMYFMNNAPWLSEVQERQLDILHNLFAPNQIPEDLQKTIAKKEADLQASFGS